MFSDSKKYSTLSKWNKKKNPVKSTKKNTQYNCPWKVLDHPNTGGKRHKKSPQWASPSEHRGAFMYPPEITK
jgi:hypothetical protein